MRAEVKREQVKRMEMRNCVQRMLNLSLVTNAGVEELVVMHDEVMRVNEVLNEVLHLMHLH